MNFPFRILAVPPLRTPTVDAARRKELLEFQKRAGLKFKNLELLDLAFCHRSYVNETSEDIDNNECLEFLGDSVLGLVAADYLFRLLPDRTEGDLARIKSHVVSEESLAAMALGIDLNRYIHVGRGEEGSGGRTRKSLLSDCMEALIGAWYLDAGCLKAFQFVRSCLKTPVDNVRRNRYRKDYKSLLQEFAQKRFHHHPYYELVDKSGPEHRRVFSVNVVVDEKSYGPGIGGNKKSAEQEAARLAWEVLGGDESP